MSAAASQRSVLLDLLRRVGEEGACVNDMVDAGGMWWKERVAEINAEPGFNIGWGLVDGEEHFHLVAEPVSTGASDERRPAIAHESGPASAGTLGQASDAPVDTQLTLIETGVLTHYDADLRAA